MDSINHDWSEQLLKLVGSQKISLTEGHQSGKTLVYLSYFYFGHDPLLTNSKWKYKLVVVDSYFPKWIYKKTFRLQENLNAMYLKIMVCPNLITWNINNSWDIWLSLSLSTIIKRGCRLDPEISIWIRKANGVYIQIVYRLEQEPVFWASWKRGIILCWYFFH